MHTDSLNHCSCSQINSNGAGGGDINVTAYSPTNRPLLCPVKEEDGVYAATFQPDEAGQWSIAVRYDEEHIQGSPFTCHVYDPNAIRVIDWLVLKGIFPHPPAPLFFFLYQEIEWDLQPQWN